MDINSISYKEIDRLDQQQLVDLLNKLLYLEVEKAKMTGADIVVPKKITSKDGGEDGKITCTSTGSSTWLKNTNILIQAKAKNLLPSECEKEILRFTLLGKKVKRRIRKVLDAGGQYILFMRYHPGSTDLIDQRKKALYDACKRTKRAYKKEQFEVYDSARIADWVNQFDSAILFVQELVGISRIAGLQTITDWAKYEHMSQVSFVTNADLDKIKAGIQGFIQRADKCARLIGHSGLGKSRLAYEALSIIPSIQHKVLYYIATTGQDEIVQFVRSNISSLSGILVVDNCSLELHNQLKNEVRKSNSAFQLLSIDYNVAEQDERSRDTEYFFLHNEYLKDVVKEILKQEYSGKLGDRELEKIAEYSEGYPGMAVRFVEARLENVENIGERLPSDIKERLVFGRDWENKEQHAEKYRVIKACSMFLHFGYPFSDIKPLYGEAKRKELLTQSLFIAEKICDPIVHQNSFSEACSFFQQKGILERRGMFYSVKPTPLAVKLAMEWWQNLFDKEKIRDLFPDLEEVNLLISFADRFKALDQLTDAQEIIADLVKATAPFGSAEVLNSESGSRLFRSFVEVNPIATSQALERAFLSLSKNDLLQVKKGRRNLVWALEMLCFRNESFVAAAKVLYAFGVSENENIGNNATKQFLQLFKIYLPGTEVALSPRLEILRWGIQHNPDYVDLAISALGSAFNAHDFHRMGGSERQGQNTILKDYEPHGSEISSYWDECMELLLKIHNQFPEKHTEVKKEVRKAVQAFVENGKTEQIFNAIKTLHTDPNEDWQDAINSLNWVLNRRHSSDQEKEKIKQILEYLQPDTMKSKIQKTVVYGDRYYSGTRRTDEEKQEEFLSLVQEITDINTQLIPYLSIILTTPQHNSFELGRIFTETHGLNPSLVEKSFEVLKTIPKDKQSPEFIVGQLYPCDEEKKKEMIERIKNDVDLQHHVFYFARVLSPDLATIDSLFDLVANGSVDIGHYGNLLYGRILEKLKISDLVYLTDKIKTLGKRGEWICLEFLYQGTYDIPERWAEAKEHIKNLILSTNYFLNHDRGVGMGSYHWSESIRLLFKDTHDKELAQELSNQIVELLKQQNVDTHDHTLRNLCRILILDYFDAFFDAVSGCLISRNIDGLHARFLFSSEKGWSRTESTGLLFKNEAYYDRIIQFCRDHTANRAPERIAGIMPIYLRDEDVVSWHPFAIKILDEFGDEESVLSEITANLGTFGSIGSTIPYYRMIQELVNQLKDHKSSAVRKWAKEQYDYMGRSITRAHIEDEHDLL